MKDQLRLLRDCIMATSLLSYSKGMTVVRLRYWKLPRKYTGKADALKSSCTIGNC